MSINSRRLPETHLRCHKVHSQETYRDGDSNYVMLTPTVTAGGRRVIGLRAQGFRIHAHCRAHWSSADGRGPKATFSVISLLFGGKILETQEVLSETRVQMGRGIRKRGWGGAEENGKRGASARRGKVKARRGEVKAQRASAKRRRRGRESTKRERKVRTRREPCGK